MGDIQNILDTIERYFAQRPYYYTDDGTRFYANPSHRKAKTLQYVGRYRNAKEARAAWDYRQNILCGNDSDSDIQPPLF